jgi:hypothetical protein
MIPRLVEREPAFLILSKAMKRTAPLAAVPLKSINVVSAFFHCAVLRATHDDESRTADVQCTQSFIPGHSIDENEWIVGSYDCPLLSLELRSRFGKLERILREHRISALLFLQDGSPVIP